MYCSTTSKSSMGPIIQPVTLKRPFFWRRSDNSCAGRPHIRRAVLAKGLSERPMHAEVVLQEETPIGLALLQFSRKCKLDGVYAQAKRRAHFESSHDRKLRMQQQRGQWRRRKRLDAYRKSGAQVWEAERTRGAFADLFGEVAGGSAAVWDKSLNVDPETNSCPENLRRAGNKPGAGTSQGSSLVKPAAAPHPPPRPVAGPFQDAVATGRMLVQLSRSRRNSVNLRGAGEPIGAAASPTNEEADMQRAGTSLGGSGAADNNSPGGLIPASDVGNREHGELWDSVSVTGDCGRAGELVSANGTAGKEQAGEVVVSAKGLAVQEERGRPSPVSVTGDDGGARGLVSANGTAETEGAGELVSTADDGAQRNHVRGQASANGIESMERSGGLGSALRDVSCLKAVPSPAVVDGARARFAASLYSGAEPARQGYPQHGTQAWRGSAGRRLWTASRDPVPRGADEVSELAKSLSRASQAPSGAPPAGASLLGYREGMGQLLEPDGAPRQALSGRNGQEGDEVPTVGDPSHTHGCSAGSLHCIGGGQGHQSAVHIVQLAVQEDAAAWVAGVRAYAEDIQHLEEPRPEAVEHPVSPPSGSNDVKVVEQAQDCKSSTEAVAEKHGACGTAGPVPVGAGRVVPEVIPEGFPEAAAGLGHPSGGGDGQAGVGRHAVPESPQRALAGSAELEAGGQGFPLLPGGYVPSGEAGSTAGRPPPHDAQVPATPADAMDVEGALYKPRRVRGPCQDMPAKAAARRTYSVYKSPLEEVAMRLGRPSSARALQAALTSLANLSVGTDLHTRTGYRPHRDPSDDDRSPSPSARPRELQSR
eukprot:jgi/Botrbrau1/6374/Bobra.0098s0033.2